MEFFFVKRLLFLLCIYLMLRFFKVYYMLYVVFFNCEIFGNSIIKFLMGEIRKIDFGVDLVRGGRNIVSII